VNRPPRLSELRTSIEGFLPPTFATVDARGMPNAIHISQAMVLTDDQVGLSRQFQRKTLVNLERDPRGCLYVTDQDTFDQWRLYLRRIRVDTSGPHFDAMRARIDAIAGMTGMSQVFRLKAVDVFELERILPVQGVDG
jgi:adenylate cyclase